MNPVNKKKSKLNIVQEDGGGPIVGIDEWQERFTKPIVLEIAKIVTAEERKMGLEAGGVLHAGVVAGMVCAAVTTTLNDYAAATEGMVTELREKAMFARFAELKASMEKAVAAGFQASMSMAVGRSVEYYCQILPVPAAVNKQPC